MADTTVKAKITSTSKGLIFPVKWHEPFGLPQVINEAFLHKTPVISTNVGGISEVITHNINGYLTHKGDFKQLAHYLIKLSENKNIRHNFVELSYNQVLNSFSTNVMAKKL